MARLIYQLPSDNVAPNVTPVLFSGTADPTYPVTNVISVQPSRPAHFTSHALFLYWDFGDAQRIDLAAIINHNFTAGTTRAFLMASPDNLLSPTFTVEFTIPADMSNGLPVCPWIDIVGTYGVTAYRYWGLSIIDNPENLWVGTVWLGALKRSLAVNIHWGLVPMDDHKVIERSTDYGVPNVFDIGCMVRSIDGVVDTTDAGRDALVDWHRACGGRSRPSLIVPDPALNDALLVRWASAKLPRQMNFRDVNRVNLNWVEESRGLRLKNTIF